MKFDKTFIVIRERSILELFDLSLHVISDHFRPLFWLLIIGSMPWAVLDFWLVGWLVDDYDFPAIYYWLMALLVIGQAQIGTTLMTQYLGQAMFVGRPGIGATIRSTFKTNLYFLWVHGGLRAVFPMAILCLFLLNGDFNSQAVVSFLMLPAMLIYALFVRSFRPYVSEILLLERTPIFQKDPASICFGNRSKAFHLAAGGDLFGQFVLSIIYGSLLLFSIFSLLVTIDSVLNIRANSELSYSPYYWIISLWAVSGFICVARFLTYINFRIIQEGWAVELRMRAEGQRLTHAAD